MNDLSLEKGRVTQLLIEFGRGDKKAFDRLFPVVYDKLQQIARHQVLRRTGDEPLQKTELIHEVYLKLIDQTRTEWNDRAHFFAVAAKAMRHILVDHHRRQKAKKRGGSKLHVTFKEQDFPIDEYSEHLEALQELMEQLEQANPRMHTIVDLRFFAGFTIEEIAELLNISTSTVDRDWKAARGWLFQQLTDQ